MAHEITASDRPVYAKTGAWHGLGRVIQGAHDLDTMIDEAGLRGYVVEHQPVYVSRPSHADDGRSMFPVKGYQAVVRLDTGDALAVTTDSYQLFQYAEGAEFLRGLMADGLIDVESTGTLRGGRRWWILANVPSETYTIAGDLHQTYMLIDSSHDGSHAVHARSTSVRVVCANTLNAANASKADNQTSFRFLHTLNLQERVKAAQSALTFVTEQQRRLAQFLAQSAVTPVTSDDCARLGVHLFGPVEDRGTRVKNNVSRFASIVREERGRNDGKLTAYTLINGITGYADHARTGASALWRPTIEQQEKRFESSFDGGGAAFKASGLDFVRELVTV